MNGFALLSYGLTAVLLIIALRDARIHLLPQLLNNKPYQHFFFATIFGLFLLWSAQASIKEGLSLHLLMVTTFTQLFGWTIALVIGVVITILLLVTQQLSIDSLPAFLLFTVVLSISLSHLLSQMVHRLLPKHLFIYLFVGVFSTAAVVGTVHLTSHAFYQLFIGHYDWQTIVDNYYVFAFLLAFPEALLNGLCMTLMVVFKPEWVRNYSDRDYLNN
ncbi:energy-coupling factor ABC transporter permease [Vibrio ulleungensis]|uniref:energy-coupling factor ABC transporter permease n=1 Tax=Vibrio ulleungensis TaxID=2807619 RepID=UPI001F3F8B51|nr:energy-coupling factor ABC transporter permease [Vibrio ulleungensis]